ncbi:23S rRNA (cytidine1920-2'-O)/16S rRNA (cytidine1409-2'-O)-methyltransferase [Arthrobacter sp. PvP102]|uniref:TlyA family RNA methyltransferase n=1 Tax=unclassified Arthrobacter TaxID=235627 RepID=UPI001AE132CB|nr:MULTISPECIES: TlyA family RNA methyltransferase [unclassified Arthrobacter]MBP1235973.1 23S rRNA (cytidine1920-2'-O)/16S rRNA (cytidine1409-2'-O)-methyltransferase [Arthrobacter sp. PvP102]
MARLDQMLVARGLARSRTHAARLIAEGKVSSEGTVLAKASAQVDDLTPLDVADDGQDTYVSRAGHKLAGALEAFPEVIAEGKRCLDAGASTGGFTEVLLRRGADHVVAVDVGHGQLVPQLRDDPRVSVHEGLNVRYMTPEEIGGPVALTVADLSFISLTLVLEPLAACTEPGGDLVLMVKPQFEIGKDRLGRTGVVNSGRERRMAVEKVAQAALDAGLELRGLAASPLPGQDGNVEYFLWIKRRITSDLPKIEERDAAVAALLGTIWPNN